MSEKKIIIFSNRFLIVKGLACLIQENYGIEPVVFGNEADFVNYVRMLQKAIIIWDNDLFSEEAVSQLNFNNYIILTIGRISPHLRSYTVDFIPLKAESSYIISMLKNYLDKLQSHSIPEEESKTDLTERERQIVRLIAMGKTNQQIAGELSISPHTVITHRKNISSKLGIKTIAGLTIYAILNGLVSIEEIENVIK